MSLIKPSTINHDHASLYSITYCLLYINIDSLPRSDTLIPDLIRCKVVAIW